MTGVSRLTGTLEPAASTVVDTRPKAVPKSPPPQKQSLGELTGLSSLREASIPRTANRVRSAALPASSPGVGFNSGPGTSPAPFVASSGTSAIGSQKFEADSSKGGDSIEKQADPFAATANSQMAMQLLTAQIDLGRKFYDALSKIGIDGAKNAADAVKR